MKKLTQLSSLLLLTVLPQISVAEQENADKKIDGTLESVTVSAMRFADSLYESPTNGVTITSVEIADSGLISVAEALNRFSDVYIRNLGGGTFMGQPSLRGFGMNSQSRVLVLLDGQRLNNIDIGGINWGQVQMSDIENIEVLYGAHTATYGSFAESGVIKISTKKWGQNGAKFGTTYGEYGEYSFYGNATYSNDDYYASVGANYYHNGGFFANSLSWNKSASLKAGVRLDSQNELGLYVNVGNMFISWPGYIYSPTSGGMRDVFPNGLTHTEQDRVDYMTISTSWENYSAIGEGSAHLGVNVRDKSVDWGTYITDSTTWTLSFDPKYRVYIDADDKSYIEGGVDIFYDNFTEKSGSTYSSEVNRVTLAPWIGSKLQTTEKLSFTASARYEVAINDATSESAFYNLDDNEAVNGIAAQLGANYQLTDNWNVYARFDQIYHYPSIDERYSIHGFGGFYANDDLDPEHGQNYEIGTNFSKYGFSFNGSLFYTRLNDEIATDPMGRNKNIGETNRYGAQIRLGYNYEDMLGAYSSWTFVDAQYASGIHKDREIACVPDITSKSGVWVRPVKYVMAELNFIWASNQYQDGYLDTNSITSKIPDSYSLDLTINISPCEHARIFFAITNITDHINCSYAGWNCWYPEPGRTIRAGIELSF